MSKAKKMNKKVELNTSSVKVDLTSASRDFVDTVGKFYVATCEVADTTEIYRQNVKILSASVSELEGKLLENGNLSDKDRERLIADKKALSAYQQKFSYYKAESMERISACYALIPDSLFTAYQKFATSNNDVDFRREIKTWLDGTGIPVTPSLLKFMTFALSGFKKATSKQVVSSEGTNLLRVKGQKEFNEIFMLAFCKILVDRNKIVPSRYAFQFKESETFTACDRVDNAVKVEKPKKDKVEKTSKSKKAA